MKSFPICFLTATAFMSTICNASTFFSVTGITGIDGSLPVVEGNLPVASGQQLIATGGDVELYFAGYAADDTDVVADGVTIFTNGITPLGSVFDLGVKAPGTVITLSLQNLTTGQTYSTGPASLNPDDMIHSAYASWTANTAIPQNGIFVGFEDLSPPYSDGDFNDSMLVASGVTTTPEPPEFATIGFVLIGLAKLRRKRGANTST